jgi:hypothetical protein
VGGLLGGVGVGKGRSRGPVDRVVDGRLVSRRATRVLVDGRGGPVDFIVAVSTLTAGTYRASASTARRGMRVSTNLSPSLGLAWVFFRFGVGMRHSMEKAVQFVQGTPRLAASQRTWGGYSLAMAGTDATHFAGVACLWTTTMISTLNIMRQIHHRLDETSVPRHPQRISRRRASRAGVTTGP